MKLTNEKLRELIKEEMDNLDYNREQVGMDWLKEAIDVFLLDILRALRVAARKGTIRDNFVDEWVKKQGESLFDEIASKLEPDDASGDMSLE